MHIAILTVQRGSEIQRGIGTYSESQHQESLGSVWGLVFRCKLSAPGLSEWPKSSWMEDRVENGTRQLWNWSHVTWFEVYAGWVAGKGAVQEEAETRWAKKEKPHTCNLLQAAHGPTWKDRRWEDQSLRSEHWGRLGAEPRAGMGTGLIWEPCEAVSGNSIGQRLRRFYWYSFTRLLCCFHLYFSSILLLLLLLLLLLGWAHSFGN